MAIVGAEVTIANGARSRTGPTDRRATVGADMPQRAITGREDEPAAGVPAGRELDLEQVRKAIAGLRYGEVRVIIQDGVIVQIERVEKRRLR